MNLVEAIRLASRTNHPFTAAASAEDAARSDRAIGVAVSAFVILGVAVRVWRYLLRFPLWGDECFLAVNFIERGYFDLLRPLDYYQVAPPLFLWIELVIVRMLGFNEWSLRLFPFACGLASLFLFRHVAGRLVRGLPLLWAVAIFAVAYYPIRHSAECKPYASDLLVSLFLLTMAVEWWRSRAPRWLWILAAGVPLAILLSYPAVFVAGSISVTIGAHLGAAMINGRTHKSEPARRLGATVRAALTQLLRQPSGGSNVAAYAVFNLLLIASFAALLVVGTRQHESYVHEGNLGIFWRKAFPPLTSPIQFAGWLGEIHTSHMFAYPVGGARGASTLTFLCFVIGLVALWRRRHRTLLSLSLVPFALAFVAAAAGRYPYGGSTRVALYLAPIICLLTGVGMAAVWSRVRRERLRRGLVLSGLVLLGTLGVGIMAWDLVYPFKASHDLRMRDFARWFWVDKAYGAELVCARSDLRLDIFPQSYPWRGMAQYLCNQRIYSERHRRGASPDWQALSDARPLRCAVFNAPASNQNAESFQRWLARMQVDYRIVGREAHDFHKFYDGRSPDRERVEVYEFVPRSDRSPTSIGATSGPIRPPVGN